MRVGLSPLKSHKKSHNFQDIPDDSCACSLNVETTQHFLLQYPSYNEHRHLLFQTLNPILLANDINHRNDCELVRLLLYGNEKLKFHVNHLLLKVTMNFIGKLYVSHKPNVLDHLISTLSHFLPMSFLFLYTNKFG